MTRPLYLALAGRLAAMAAAALVLAGVTGHAALSRPAAAEPRMGSTACFDPAAPSRGWISCAGEAPL